MRSSIAKLDTRRARVVDERQRFRPHHDAERQIVPPPAKFCVVHRWPSIKPTSAARVAQ